MSVGRNITVKRWLHEGIKFAEWELPATGPPHFEEKGKKEGRARRRFVVHMFDRRKTPLPMEELVETCLDMAGAPRMPMPKGGEKARAFEFPDAPTHFVIVRVEGRPVLVGVMAAYAELVPVRDFYEWVSYREA